MTTVQQVTAMFQVVLSLSLTVVDASCNFLNCPYQYCKCSGTTIGCANLGLEYIPTTYIYNCTPLPSVDFENNQIEAITAGSLTSNLVEINFKNNPLTTIDDSAFNDSASTLKRLSFSNFKFSQIPDALLYVTSLISLSLSDSKIVNWTTPVMQNIGKTILTLEIDNMGLSSWPPWIQYFSQVTELRIVNNFISDIPDDGFDSLHDSLYSLYLSNNQLTSVPKALTNINALQMLYLNNNKVKDINWLSQVNSLVTLSLAYNQISDGRNLSNALSNFADTLFDIDLHGNRLTVIPELNFLEGIQKMDLSYNLISNPSSGSLPSMLTSLDLDNNNLSFFPLMVKNLKYLTEFIINTNSISAIRGEDFAPQTITIILAYNLISELTDSSFPQNSNIQTLNLNDNPLSKVSPNAFVNLPYLSVLHVRNTKLTRLPLGIASLVQLTSFEIVGTLDLVCTCNEKPLQPVITAMGPDKVKGECGLTTVYDFFLKLSPSCP